MKNYTFTLKKNNNSFDNNYNAESTLKTILASNLADKYSWFAAPKAAPTRTKVIYVNNPSINSYSSVPTFKTYYDFDSDYLKAINLLDNYGKRYGTYTNRDEYDYEIDGTPVRIWDNMMQIGYHIIPTNASSTYYIGLKPAVKKLIVDITIKISNHNY